MAEIRKEVECPICLGIIRKTRTVMECLHRFCRECIDKSMRIGNNECPACRTHCASRRSLRDDPNYDALIAALYPDIDKYEEEELTFHDDEVARNKLIQDSIAEAFRRQTEVNGKRRASTKAKKQGNYRCMKVQRSRRHGSDEEEVARGHDGNKDSSSNDDISPQAKSKRYRRSGGAGPSHPSSGPNADDSDMSTELLGASASLCSAELLAWGRGGMRSNTRHAGPSSTNHRPSNGNRIARLIEHLKGAEERDKINVILHILLQPQSSVSVRTSVLVVTLEEEKIPKLEIPYLSCTSKSTVGYLCQEVAKQTSVEASEIEMLLVKGYCPVYKNSIRQMDSGIVDPSEYELLLLDEHMTVEEIHMTFYELNLALGYRLKA
ncbi:Ubiquitin--protein ligase [Handroanthus impetiginosus]|uniref:Ubiquitin--protein ligase n=1 Tax=Handroanthus impetiginosus TaxID=429701 RepID=A0A2G9GTG9_9LAMI|nr:Ubiquitin--protein ligase [Handroanthus impetiginosus]